MERGNLSKENDPTKGQPEMLDAIKCRVYHVVWQKNRRILIQEILKVVSRWYNAN